MDDLQKRSWAEIFTDNIRHNYRAIRAQLPEGCRFLGVVKADAYGHGALRVSQILEDEGADYLAVSCLDEALELFRLPRTIGRFEGFDLQVNEGRFGPYVQHNRKYVSIPKDIDPLTITREEAVELIEKSRDQEKQRHVKSFEEDAELEVMNGRYGPYISYKGKNYRMPKAMHERATELTYEECMEVVNTPVKTKK